MESPPSPYEEILFFKLVTNYTPRHSASAGCLLVSECLFFKTLQLIKRNTSKSFVCTCRASLARHLFHTRTHTQNHSFISTVQIVTAPQNAAIIASISDMLIVRLGRIGSVRSTSSYSDDCCGTEYWVKLVTGKFHMGYWLTTPRCTQRNTANELFWDTHLMTQLRVRCQ